MAFTNNGTNNRTQPHLANVDDMTLLTQGFSILLYDNPNALNNGKTTVTITDTIIYKATLKAIENSKNNNQNKANLNLNISGSTNVAENLSKIISTLVNDNVNIKNLSTNLENLHKYILDTSEDHSLINIFKGILNDDFKDVEPEKAGLILALSSLLQSLNTLSEIGFLGTIRLSFVLNGLSSLMKKNFKELIVTINEAAEKIESKNDFTILSNFISAIAQICNISFKDLIKMRWLFMEITSIFNRDFKNLFRKIKEIAEDSKIGDSIKNLYYILDQILSLKDIEEKDIIKIADNMELLADVMTTSFDSLNNIKNVYNEQIYDAQSDSLERVKNIQNKINEILSGISILSILSNQTKIIGLSSEFLLMNLLIESINLLKPISNNIDLTNYKPKLDNILTIYDKFSDAEKNLNIVDILKSIIIIKGLTAETNSFKIFVDKINELDNIHKKFNELNDYKEKLVKILEIYELFNGKNISYRNIISSTKNIVFLNLATKAIIDFNKNANKLVDSINSLDELELNKIKLFDSKEKTSVINLLSNMINDINKLKDVEKVLKAIKNINLVMLEIGFIIKLTNKKTGELLRDEIDTIVDVVSKLNKIKEKDLEKAKNAVVTFSLLLTISAGILIAGSLAMALINIGDLIAFTVTLGTFIFGLSFAYKKFSEESKLMVDSAKSLMIIIAVSGAILLAAGLLFDDVNIGYIIGFAVILGTFVWGLSKIFKNFNDEQKTTITGAIAFSILLVASGGILIAAGLLFDDVNILKVAGFAVILGAFVFGLSFIFNNFNEHAGPTMQAALGFSLLLVVAGGLLIAGSYMWDMMWRGDTLDEKALNGIKAIGFVMIVGLFVWGLSKAFNANRTKTIRALASAKSVALLLVIAGGILIAGSYLCDMMFHGDTWHESLWNGIKSIIFCAILLLFIKTLIWAVTVDRKKTALAIGQAITIALLVGITGGLLLYATRFIRNEQDIRKIRIFVGSVLLLVGGMSTIMYLLSKFAQANKAGAALGMVALGLITYILYELTGIMERLTITAMILDSSKLLALFGFMALAITEIGGIIALLGAIVTTGVGAVILGLGAVAILPLIGIIDLINDMMLSLAIKSKIVGSLVSKKSLENYFDLISFSIDSLYGILKGNDKYVGLAKFARADNLVIIKLVTSGIKDLSIALSYLANAIQQWANLRIPNSFDSNGNPISFVELKSADFAKASENIGKSVSSLIEGILSVYRTYKGDGVFDLNLLGSTPYHRVIKGTKDLGPVLSSLAKSVQEWANLRIPNSFDSNGNPTSFVELKSTDFTTATGNIKSSVSSLIEGILSVYRTYKGDGVFDLNLLGSTPYHRVIKSTKQLGPVLASLAKSVKAWASLRIPISFDPKTGNPTDYLTIGKDEFSKVSFNISNTIDSLIRGLLILYESGVSVNGKKAIPYKTLFPSTTWFTLRSRSPIAIVINSIKSIGPMLGSVAEGFKEWANLRIPVKFNKDGKPIEYKTIASSDFKAVQTNVCNVVSALAKALLTTYASLKSQNLIITATEEFTGISEFGGLLKIGKTKKTGSPLHAIASSIGMIGMTLGIIGKGVKEWADIRIPSGYDPKTGKPTGYLPITQSVDQLNKNIEIILTALGTAIINTVNKDTNKIFSSGEDSPAMIAAKSVNTISGSLVNIAKAIQAIIGGKITEYDPKTGKVIKEIDITEQLKDIDNGTLSNRIIKIITAIGAPIISLYNSSEYSSLWHSYGTGKSPAENIATSISTLTTALSNIVENIKKLSELNNGKQNITNIIDTAYDTITKILGKIILIFGIFGKPDDMKAILGDNVNNMYIDTGSKTNWLGFRTGEKHTIAEWMNSEIPNISETNNSISSLVESIKGIATSVAGLDKAIVQANIADKINPVKKGSIYDNVSSLLLTCIEIIKDSNWKLIDDNIDSFDFENLTTSVGNLVYYFSNQKTGLFLRMKMLNKAIISAGEINLTSINNNIQNLLSVYTSIMAETSKALNKEFVEKVNNLYSLLYNSEFITKNGYLINVMRSIKRITGESQLNSIQIINNIKKTQFELLESSIDSLLTSWDKIIEKINILNSKSNTSANSMFYKTEENYANINDLFEVIDKMLMLTTRLETTSINISPFEELAKGISIIDITAQNIKANAALKTQQEVMQKYVNTVNAINLYKLNTMYNFAESMNRLADKLGSLDNLTDALGNKLTLVLAKLISEMKVAEDTIKNADTLREKREKLIKDSIKEMKNIMDQHLVVDIYNQSTNQQLGDTPVDNSDDSGNTTTDDETSTTKETSAGSTPEYNGSVNNSSKPLLNENDKAKGAANFKKTVKKHTDSSLQIENTINNSINNTLRSIFKYNSKNSQYVLNLKNTR